MAVLVTRDTRDEAYLYSARRKETTMHQELDELRRKLKQRIFVGTSTGATVVSSSVHEQAMALRHDARPTEDPRRRPKDSVQETLDLE